MFLLSLPEVGIKIHDEKKPEDLKPLHDRQNSSCSPRKIGQEKEGWQWQLCHSLLNIVFKKSCVADRVPFFI
jgi:hypothetical protein